MYSGKKDIRAGRLETVNKSNCKKYLVCLILGNISVCDWYTAWIRCACGKKMMRKAMTCNKNHTANHRIFKKMDKAYAYSRHIRNPFKYE